MFPSLAYARFWDVWDYQDFILNLSVPSMPLCPYPGRGPIFDHGRTGHGSIWVDPTNPETKATASGKRPYTSDFSKGGSQRYMGINSTAAVKNRGGMILRNSPLSPRRNQKTDNPVPRNKEVHMVDTRNPV